MKRNERLILTLILPLIVGLGGVGFADSKSVDDPRDNGGFRDVRSVSHGHSSDPGMLRHSLKTFDRWRDRVLREYRIRFNMSLDDDPDIERSVRVRYDDGRLRARMYGARGQRLAGRVKVWRVSLRALTVSFDSSMLGAGIQTYRWKARFFPNVVCSKPCPGDRAPNRGLIRHRL